MSPVQSLASSVKGPQMEGDEKDPGDSLPGEVENTDLDGPMLCLSKSRGFHPVPVNHIKESPVYEPVLKEPTPTPNETTQR